MVDPVKTSKPCVVLLNINGSGMGHLSTCLAYANRLKFDARPVFFSLASAIDPIHDLGFEADYMVSRFWSRAGSVAWDRQLAQRLGLLFERVHPQAVVFDGTWPYRGLLHAAKVYGIPRLIWSDLMLYKRGKRKVPIREHHFDMLIRLGELGTRYSVEQRQKSPRKIVIPPVTILQKQALMERREAREALGLSHDGRYALFSLGPGNLKDVSGIGAGLVAELRKHGYQVVWLRPPISQSDPELPAGVIAKSIFPIARYLRAFDVYVSAAGYNSCCEVLQAEVPTLFVPNALVADDQAARARLVAGNVPAVVSNCESAEERSAAVSQLLSLDGSQPRSTTALDLDGAEIASREILDLIASPLPGRVPY